MNVFYSNYDDTSVYLSAYFLVEVEDFLAHTS